MVTSQKYAARLGQALAYCSIQCSVLSKSACDTGVIYILQAEEQVDRAHPKNPCQLISLFSITASVAWATMNNQSAKQCLRANKHNK